MDRKILSLYLVTDSGLAAARGDGTSLEDIVGQAVRGGVSIVQLREKHLPEDEFIEKGRCLKKLLDGYGVPLIINDNVRVAVECGADGVHIGQGDMSYCEARRMLGPDKIIGLSVETMEELREANGLDVDYVAASPVFSTPTKTDTARPWGLEGLREFVAASRHPVVAIGGINGTNIGEVCACGVDGTAVVSAVISAPSPFEAAKNLRHAFSAAISSAAEVSCHTLGEFGLIRRIKEAFGAWPSSGTRPDPGTWPSSGMEACSGARPSSGTEAMTLPRRASGGITGIGDDCAILPQHTGRQTLVSTDMLLEGTHFLLDDIPARELGWKSAAVNISDIAAMGGTPVATFLSCALPQRIGIAWINEFIDGYRACSTRFGAPLLGGDTTSSPDRLCINVTVLGECLPGKAKLRSSARPGDLVCVTGELGDSAGGLHVILKGLEREGAAGRLVHRHYHPEPRIMAGLELAKCDGVHAMMDISDGVASDLRHILEESGVSAVIDTSAIPLSADLIEVCRLLEPGGGYSDEITPVKLALSGGEDYELLFTVDPVAEKRLGAVRHFIIGKITEKGADGPKLEWSGTHGDFMGFRHF